MAAPAWEISNPGEFEAAGGDLLVATSALLLLAFSLYAGVLSSPFLGMRAAPMIFFATSIGLLARPALGFADYVPKHVGIASGVPEIATYEIGILWILLATMGARVERKIVYMLGAAAVYLAAMTLLAWPEGANITSGLIHYGFLLLSFLAGVSSARSGWFRGRGLTAFTWLFAAFWVFQLCLCLAQNFLGFSHLNSSDTAEIFLVERRALGSFSHPDDLGKLVLMSFVLLLPATGRNSALSRLGAWIAIFAGIMASALTGARANILAELTALVVWGLLSYLGKVKRARLRLRYVIPLAVLAVPGIQSVRDRFQIDAEGGDRRHLLAVGLGVVRDFFFTGLGPNNYVEYVGRFDPITAQGLPVHNVFLLVTAEIGVFGACLLFLPILLTTFVAFSRWRSDSEYAPWALGVIAILPGLLLVCMTGWGMIAGAPGVFWYFVFGCAFGQLTGWSLPQARTPDRSLRLSGSLS
jgi:hypothetical protein